MKKIFKLFAAFLAIMLIPAYLVACGKTETPTPPVFKLDKTGIELTVGGNIEVLTLTISDVDETPVWASSNESVATVTVSSSENKAIVKGISEGGAVITAKAGSYTAICTVIVNQGLYITLDKEELEIFAGRTATITPSTNITTPLTYTSSNENVARVSNTGVVSGISGGYATITVSGGSKSASCAVTVIEPIITLNKELVELTMVEGENTFQLEVTTNSTGRVEWKSNDENVATIDDYGLITAKGLGNTTITVSYQNVEVDCVVKVKDELLTVSLSENEKELPLGESFTLSATVEGSKSGILEGDDAAVIWSVKEVEGKNVVSVEDGLVTASDTTYGKAIVRATSVKDPDKHADCLVTVPDPKGDWIKIFDRASFESAMKAGNENKNMYLTNDIDLQGAEINSTLGNFNATFDGMGYEIKNFTCSKGLLGGINPDGTVKNLAITCSSGRSGEFYGLFGQFILGRLENCRIDVTVLENNQSGIANHLNINPVVDHVIVLVRNPLNKSGIYPGFFENNAFITYCTNSYCAVLEGTADGPVRGPEKKTEDELKQASLYAGWDTDIWQIEDGEIPVLLNDNSGLRVSISETESTLYVGETLELSATVKPSKLPEEEKGIIWTSSDDSVASVDQYGVVTALKAGTAVITATSEKDSAKYVTCTVTVHPIELTINSEDKIAELKIHATKQLHVTVNHGGYVWETSNESIATVENGLITAVGEGEVTITVRSLLDNTVTDSITFTVKATIDISVTLDESELTLDRDDSAQLTAFVTNSDGGVNWTSSDDSVASVDEFGVITTHGKDGTAIITATAREDNGAGFYASAQCTVTVEYVQEEITVDEEPITLSLTQSVSISDIATASKGEFTLALKSGSSEGIVSLADNKITAIGEGSVTVLLTWSIAYDDIQDVVFEISVTVFVPAVELSINAERLALKVGESSNARILYVTMDVMPANPGAQDITWTSNNSSVIDGITAGYASGSYTGTLNVKGEGKAVITATYTIGGIDYKISCEVAVFSVTGSWTAVYDLNTFKQVWGANDGNFYLAHDLDLNGATVSKARNDYRAVFDGRGFTVSNFTTNALFMYNEGVSLIENVKLVCTLDGNSPNEGILGHHGNGGTIRNCYFDVTFGTNLAGVSPALMNHINTGIFENIIVATHNPNGKSGVHADFFESGGTVKNMISYCEDSSIGSPKKGAAKTENQMKSAATFEGWDGWIVAEGEFPRIKTAWDA